MIKDDHWAVEDEPSKEIKKETSEKEDLKEKLNYL